MARVVSPEDDLTLETLVDVNANPAVSDGLDNTLGGLLRTRARTQTDVVAFIFFPDGEGRQEKLTYGELHTAARRLAGTLANVTSPGDRLCAASRSVGIAPVFVGFYRDPERADADPFKCHCELQRTSSGAWLNGRTGGRNLAPP
jgi:hypothetical protein